MPTQVKVPQMGESITSGVIAVWHVQDGDHVSEGQHLFDLETDKITSEGVAETSGVIKLLVPEGEEVEIGAVIAEIIPADNLEEPAAAAPRSDQTESDAPASKGSQDSAETAAYSPAVRRIAEESGLDPSTVSGTGKGGRVTKADMLKALEERGTETSEQPSEGAHPTQPEVALRAPRPQEQEAPKPSPSGSNRTVRRKMSPLRKRIAEHLVSAQRTAAILTTFNEADMSAVIALRKRHQESFQKRHGVKLGFMSFFVKASVHALRAVPAVAHQIDGNEIVENNFFDIGVALSTDRGLMVPVVRDADILTFAAIEKQLIDFGTKAKEGKITIDDLQGGVFTISNGGIFGSLLSTPILNQPQSGILGMHAIQERPVVVQNQIVARPMMYLALSYDHRIVDGREAVTFLLKIKEAIEEPERLFLDI